MDNFFLALTTLEMLCANMYMFHICSEKRYSIWVILFVIGLFTLLFLGAGQLFLGNANYLGSGIFVVCGVVYLLPLIFLYRQPIRYSVTIMCSTWIYTMLLYALSIQIAGLLPQWNYRASLLVIQTVLYTLTIRPFFKFANKKFIYIIRNADQKTRNLLFWLGICWCLFISLLSYLRIYNTSSYAAKIINILILCIAAVNALMTYQIFYSFRRENQNALEFENALRIDDLTGLKNRIAFFEEAQSMVDSRMPFTIFFIDLDHFKSVNDDYGHVKGDQYLKHFSNSFSASFSAFGTIYRISGDEFVFLYTGKHNHLIDKKIGHFGMCDCGGISFKGFSMGSASYPGDAKALNQLIMTADKRMYKEKKVRD